MRRSTENYTHWRDAGPEELGRMTDPNLTDAEAGLGDVVYTPQADTLRELTVRAAEIAQQDPTSAVAISNALTQRESETHVPVEDSRVRGPVEDSRALSVLGQAVAAARLLIQTRMTQTRNKLPPPYIQGA